MTTFFRRPGRNAVAAGLGRMQFLTSDRANLVTEVAFGRDRDTSLFNTAEDGPPVTLNGVDPTYGDHFLVTKGTGSGVGGADLLGGIDTHVDDAEAMTILAFYAFATNDSTATWSTIAGTTIGINQIFLYTGEGSGGHAINFQVGLTDATTADSSIVATAPYGDFRGIGARISGHAAPTLKLDEFKGGVRTQGVVDSNPSKTRDNPAGTLKIGLIGLVGDPTKIAAMLIWERNLSDAELLAAYQEARGVLTGWGISC